jgi:hypothetical protein
MPERGTDLRNPMHASEQALAQNAGRTGGKSSGGELFGAHGHWYSTAVPALSRKARLAAPAGAALLALAACTGTRFVDPHPPELVRLDREYQPTEVEEPVVYAVIFDLHIADPTECEPVKTRLRQQLRDAMLASGRRGGELPAQDLSPTCVQQPDRSMNEEAFNAAVVSMEGIFGARHVRPILVYFNNVDLPIPNALKTDLVNLRHLANQRGAPVPMLWGLGLPRLLSDTTFDLSSRWTYSTDPSLLSELVRGAQTDLPLIALQGTPAGGLPLFTDAELTWVKEFRTCGADPRLSGFDFALGPPSQQLDPAWPPHYQFQVNASAPPVLRSQLQNNPLTFYIEACKANCERFVDLPAQAGLAIWNRHPHCVL